MKRTRKKICPVKATGEEIATATAARIGVPYLRRIMRYGNAPGTLAERLHYITGLPLNRFIYRTKPLKGGCTKTGWRGRQPAPAKSAGRVIA